MAAGLPLFLYPCAMDMDPLKRFVVLSALLVAASGCYVFPSDVPNPCLGVTCGPGALCRPTADGMSYNCECPTSCPSYGDHDGSKPLCASDAKDYSGECEMRRAACKPNANITFKYYGKCDPCAGVTCPDPEVCQLNERRQPACRCAEPCPLEFSPVCASDGKTYSNECQMHRESCRARKQLKIVFKGQCSTGVNPCAEVECRHGAECRVEGSGAVCACPPPCEPVLRPVCGSDSKTHDSECELKRAGCLLGRELRVLHAGACGSNGICAGRVCPHGGECVVTGARGVCRCPRCSNEFAPVCGSDGISYGNRCKLQLEACRHRRDVTVLYDGPCNGCENKKCEYYAVCESDGVSEASCVCPKHCEEGTETEEVCGTDNQTYSSACALQGVACREKRKLHVKHMGSCESCSGVDCPTGTWCARGACSCSNPCSDMPREPVCSNTGHTFIHECAFKRAACEASMRGEQPIAIKYYGECTEDESSAGSNKSAKVTDLTNEIRSEDDLGESSSETVSGTAVCARVQCAYEATCAVDASGQPRCACLFDCAAAAAASSTPVCASDLRLYSTLCHMKLEACRRQEDLRLRPLPLCRGLEFKPCGDDEQVTDVEGRPLDCGGGPRRKDCPAGSYCHHTTKAARCCKKDKTFPEKKGCQESWHGCCSDGVTSARGPGGAGCPSQCGCHRLGSESERCDDDGQCTCRPGVGGQKCDRCEPGYWGLPRIGTGAGHTGCIPCGCSAFGSVREDCEQMTGRCVCKPGIQGQKCTICSNHEHTLGPKGCYDPESTQLPATNCEHMTCYFGAYCLIRSGLATCECGATECSDQGPSVCGSDGRTYISACHLRAHSCRTQSDIVVQAFGPCGHDSPHVRKGSRFGRSTRSLEHVKKAKQMLDLVNSRGRIVQFVDASVDTSDSRVGRSIQSSKRVKEAKQTLGSADNSADRVEDSIQFVDASVDTSDSGKPDSPDPESELTCVDILPPVDSECLPLGNKEICSGKPKPSPLIYDEYENLIYDFEDDYQIQEDIEDHVKDIYRDPLFDGKGFLNIRMRLPAKRFDISAEVSAVCGNGTLITASGSRDHLWLGFVNDRAVLRWDAGNGPLELRAGKVKTDRRTIVSARRYKKDAVLRLGMMSTRGKAQGKMNSLDVEPFIFVGRPPDNVTRLLGRNSLQGFVGCVHRLRINGRDLIPPARGVSVTSNGLQHCTPHNLARLECP